MVWSEMVFKAAATKSLSATRGMKSSFKYQQSKIQLQQGEKKNLHPKNFGQKNPKKHNFEVGRSLTFTLLLFACPQRDVSTNQNIKFSIFKIRSKTVLKAATRHNKNNTNEKVTIQPLFFFWWIWLLLVFSFIQFTGLLPFSSLKDKKIPGNVFYGAP